MKGVLFSIIGMLCHALMSSAQTCPLSDILSPVVTYQLDIAGLEDIAWKAEPIDTNGDGKKDDGFIGVGQAQFSSTPNRQALIVRLNPNLTLYSADWPVTVGGNQNDVAYSAIQASDGNIVVCGKKTSTKYGGSANSNVWIFKLDLIDGDTIPGTVHEYGGSGDDIGYDIVEDVTAGNYVIAGGTGNGANGDLSGYTINGLGEYWILAIDTGDFTIAWDTIYHGDYTGGSLDDWAESIIIDHNGHYVVSGYCSSCQEDKVQMEAMLVKMENDGDFLWKKVYGDASADIDSMRDHGSFSVIETYNATTGKYHYLSTGVSHPWDCFNGHNHDLYVFKTDSDGNDVWTPGCELDEGISFGGGKKDDGFYATQTCDGHYLLAGDAASPSGDYDVNCNHDTLSPYTPDAWLLKISSSGARLWDESLGGLNGDEAHSIKSVPDGSYVIAGEFGGGVLTQLDFYMAKFELSACDPPSGLNVSTSGCQATFTWNSKACIPKYILKYKKLFASTWTTVDPAVSPVVITGSGRYIWTVQAQCSPNVISVPDTGATFQLNCKIGEEEIGGREIISLYPNPSDDFIAISLAINQEIDELTLIEILDQAGKLVTASPVKIENGLINERLSISHFQSGFYYIRIKVNRMEYLCKLVIQNR